jgi:ribosomal peptide maturation radical SAM protein 1
MPWQALRSPVLSLGLLRAAAVRAGFDPPRICHANVRWAEFLLDRSYGELTPTAYTDIAEQGIFHGLGDWVFTGVLHDDPAFGIDALREYAVNAKLDTRTAQRMREYAGEFVELTIADILATEPSLVGFTSTFMQNVPSLAVAKRLKALRPNLATVFGGANCEGPMGVALHRNYRFVDFVVRGEGEEAFPALLEALSGTSSLAAVPGLCWWDSDGEQRVNDTKPPVPAGRLPVPDFDDWFDLMDGSAVSNHIEPRLLLETSRGCWWGEKHHCTFCGLNGNVMQFRAKSPERVVAEISAQVRRHRVLDIDTTDNITDMRYFTDLLPRVRALGWDLQIFFEVKSNLKPAEIAALRDAGVFHVQPGIESLVTPVLELMDKGVTAVQNVRMLRESESAGLTLSWNWLYGFAGETAAQYESILDQLPALVHLQPPDGVVRIVLERFSPNFDNPGFGFGVRRPSRMYRHVYDLDEVELSDLVYLFETEHRGLTTAEVQPLGKLVDAWADGYVASSLVRTETVDALTISDLRAGWPADQYHIEDQRLRQAYLELEHGRSAVGVRRRLAERGIDVAEPELLRWLGELRERGLVLQDNGQWITLATRSVPVKFDVERDGLI